MLAFAAYFHAQQQAADALTAFCAGVGIEVVVPPVELVGLVPTGQIVSWRFGERHEAAPASAETWR